MVEWTLNQTHGNYVLPDLAGCPSLPHVMLQPPTPTLAYIHSVPQMCEAHSLLEDLALTIPGELCLSGFSSSTSKG